MSILNSLIRKQIFNQRYIRRIARANQAAVRQMLERVAARIEREPNNERLYEIQAGLERRLNIDLEELQQKIEEELIDFAGSEVEFLTNVMELNSNAVLRAPDLPLLITYMQKNALDAPNGPNTLSLGEALSQFAKGQVRKIRQVLIDGVAMGDTMQDMARQIRALAEGRSKAQVEALTRTLTNHASSQVRKAFVQNNAEVFDGEEWVAVLDSRTTLLCAGRSGRVYKVGNGPYPPAHWNCRSVRVPVLKKDFEKVGQKSKAKNFDSWLKGQSKDFQKEYFDGFPDGEEKLALFRDGNLDIQQFRDETGREYSLEELKNLYPVAFKEADLD